MSLPSQLHTSLFQCENSSELQRVFEQDYLIKKIGSRGCVGKRIFSFHKFSIRNSGASSGDVVRKLRVRRTGGGIICRETGLKVSAKTIIRETFHWMCCNLKKEEGGGLRK